jgi:radical SAM protein with 4Fe4S-binding SPASM domain
MLNYKIRAALKSFSKPSKIFSYIALNQIYKYRLLKVPILPVTLDIEPNNWCNFKCNHCQVTHWDKEKSKLTLESFIDILNMFPNLLRVKVQGMGEPFLHDSSIEMLEELDKRDISSATTSNGSVMHKDLLSRLSKLTQSSITFSLDGSDNETFEKIRINGDFDKVTKNIKALIDSNPSINVILWSVITLENIHDYEAIIDLAHSLGAKKLVFQTFLSDWGKDSMTDIIDAKNINKNDIDNITTNAQKRAKEIGLNLEIFKDNHMTKENPCIWPWKSLFIDAAGNVLPCCVIADSDTLNFGNIFEKDIKEIWNNKEYQDFRKAHRDFDIPDVCKSCYKMGES